MGRGGLFHDFLAIGWAARRAEQVTIFFGLVPAGRGCEAEVRPGSKRGTPRTWWVLGAESPHGGGGGS